MLLLFQSIAGALQGMWQFISNGIDNVVIGLQFLFFGVNSVPTLLGILPPLLGAVGILIVVVAVVKVLLNIFF